MAEEKNRGRKKDKGDNHLFTIIAHGLVIILIATVYVDMNQDSTEEMIANSWILAILVITIPSFLHFSIHYSESFLFLRKIRNRKVFSSCRQLQKAAANDSIKRKIAMGARRLVFSSYKNGIFNDHEDYYLAIKDIYSSISMLEKMYAERIKRSMPDDGLKMKLSKLSNDALIKEKARRSIVFRMIKSSIGSMLRPASKRPIIDQGIFMECIKELSRPRAKEIISQDTELSLCYNRLVEVFQIMHQEHEGYLAKDNAILEKEIKVAGLIRELIKQQDLIKLSKKDKQVSLIQKRFIEFYKALGIKADKKKKT